MTREPAAAQWAEWVPPLEDWPGAVAGLYIGSRMDSRRRGRLSFLPFHFGFPRPIRSDQVPCPAVAEACASLPPSSRNVIPTRACRLQSQPPSPSLPNQLTGVVAGLSNVFWHRCVCSSLKDPPNHTRYLGSDGKPFPYATSMASTHP